jgi:hypothetical protein
MRPLLLVMILLAWSAVAEELRNVMPSTAKVGPLPVETAPARFRLSGALDFGAVSVDADSFVPSGDISSNAPTSELRTWRVLEPLGYYPSDRGFDPEAEGRPLGAASGPPRAAARRTSF